MYNVPSVQRIELVQLMIQGIQKASKARTDSVIPDTNHLYTFQVPAFNLTFIYLGFIFQPLT